MKCNELPGFGCVTMRDYGLRYFAVFLTTILCFQLLIAEEKYCTTYQQRGDKTCTRLCRCSDDNCTNLSSLSGSCSAGCKAGWMGNKCQYRDIAKNMTNTTLNKYTVELMVSYPVGAIRILPLYVSASPTFFETKVEVSSMDDEDRKKSICTEKDLLLKKGIRKVDIYCERMTIGNRVDVHFDNVINIDKIQVFGGRNVALWKKASQSSTYDERYAKAENAVDGSDGNHMYISKSCTHTKTDSHDPYWILDLGQIHGVTWSQIDNREGRSIASRLNGFKMLTANNLIYKDNTTLPNELGKTSFVDATNSRFPYQIQHLNVTKHWESLSADSVLTLCEVQLFACRPTSSYKEDCQSLCPRNCATNSTCINTKCPVCESGWDGEYCDKVKAGALYCTASLIRACNISSGCKACKFLCHCVDDVECNVTTGECPNGCAKGWMGKACQYSNAAFNGSSFNEWIDGDETTCNPDLHELRFNKEYLIRTIRLILNVDTNSIQPTLHLVKNDTADVKIEVASSSTNFNMTCEWRGRVNKNIEVECPIIGRGNIIKVQGRNMTICEFKLYGGKNFALWSMAKQSSSNAETYNPFPASLAVDGRATTEFYSLPKTCQHTYNDLGMPAWWRVSLTNTTLITRMKIFFGNDMPEIREGMTITMYRKPGFNKTYSIKSSMHVIEFMSGLPQLLDEVEIRSGINGSGDVLQICEFQAFGCMQEPCNFCPERCRKSELCINENLHCPACEAGWEGLYCEKEVMSMGNKAAQEKSVVAGIAGGVSATVVLILLAGYGAFFLRRKSSKRKSLQKDETIDGTVKIERNTSRGSFKQNLRGDSNGSGKDMYYNISTVNSVKEMTTSSEAYYDFTVPSKPSEHAVRVHDFIDYVDERKHDATTLGEEFSKLKKGLQFSTEAATKPKNHMKNKYKNMYPYDRSRVVLDEIEGQEDSDYINASYIHGYGDVRHYIAAQGPLGETIDDFWRMIMQENVKCVQYWPEDEELLTLKHLTVKVIDTENFADFIFRKMAITKDGADRIVDQYHFTAWPDKGIPTHASSLVYFRTKVLKAGVSSPGPILVHCSAGVGRTGTFIALDYLLQQASDTGYVDVFNCVETLRRQRINMVQTQEQYMFVHLALLEALMCPTSATAAKNFSRKYEAMLEFDNVMKKEKLQIEFENLNRTSPEIPDSEFAHPGDQKQKRKNRYSNMLPVKCEIPLLAPSPNEDQYINATYLPAYREKQFFIITQMPLPNTVTDFWRLVHGQNVSTIVMLNNEYQSYNEKHALGIYWPAEQSKKETFGQYEVQLTNTVTDPDGDFDALNLTYRYMAEDPTAVRLFKAKFWPEDSNCPASIRALLKFIETAELHRKRQKSGPMIVHCMNGCERSGLYCVIQVVLERLKIEQDVAIQQIIKQMRSRRPQIIPNLDQFKFCHDVVIEYMNQYDTYSNFQ